MANLQATGQIAVEEAEMNANSLLLWLSARYQGSWQQFRTAVERLHVAGELSEGDSLEPEDAVDRLGLPLYQELRLNLERLAHVEFFARGCENGWRVVPPTLAVSPKTQGWLGVLCGARSPRLLSRLHGVASAIELETIPIPVCPDQIRMIVGDYRELGAIAHRAGLNFQIRAPMAILLSHPAVDDFALRSRFELPLGTDWSVHRFSSFNLSWIPATREDAANSSGELFRFIYQYRRHFFYCVRGEAFRIPNQVGKYIALRRHRRWVFRYNSHKHELWLPAICRPPKLVERALILCSGVPPIFDSDTKTLCYLDIPQTVAHLTSELLRQEVV